MEDDLKAETAALAAESEALLASYVELLGWRALFGQLSRLAKRRQEGRIAGIMQAAAGFLSREG